MNKYDIFISYRRDGGYDTAKHLYDLLTRDGYSVSFDIDTLRNGDFDIELLKRVEECVDFILILNKDAFARTLNPNFKKEHDWLRNELAYALSHNKNVIPVMLNGFIDFPDNLPSDIAKVVKKNGPKYDQYYFDDFYRKLKDVFLETPSPTPVLRNKGKQLFNIKVRSNLGFDLYIDNQYIERIEENEWYITQLPRGEYVFSMKNIYDGALDVIEKKLTIYDGDALLEVDLLSLQEQRKRKEVSAIELIEEKYGKGFYEFSCGLCSVRVNGLWGYVDADLNERIPCIYSGTNDFNPYSCCAIVNRMGRYGVINTEGVVIIPMDYDKIRDDKQGSDYLRCIKNGKCGIISWSGAECLPFLYQGLSPIQGNKCIVKLDEKYGIYDIENKELILACDYQGIRLFDSYAIISIDNKYGVFILENRSFITEILYDEIKPFHENVAAVKENEHWGFIDVVGKLQVPVILDDCDSFNSELAPVCMKGKWGYMNHHGKLEIPIRYDSATIMFGGRAVVSLNGEYGLIDRDEKILYPFSANARFLYDVRIIDYPQNPYLVQEDDKSFILIDYYGRKHEVEVKELFDNYICDFEKQLYLFTKEAGLLDSSYVEYSNDCDSDSLEIKESENESAFFWEEDIHVWTEEKEFSEGLICVKDQNGKYGYIDISRRIVIPCQWDYASSFSEGMAVVSNQEKGYGYIDKNGKVVIPIQTTIKVASSFKDGKAIIIDDNSNLLYIDKTGKILGNVESSLPNAKIPTYDELVAQRKADWELCYGYNAIKVGDTITIDNRVSVVLDYGEKGYLIASKQAEYKAFERVGAIDKLMKSLFMKSSVVDAHDEYDGYQNSSKIIRSVRDEEELEKRYPALGWCVMGPWRNMGRTNTKVNWYLPAISEWIKITENPDINTFFGEDVCHKKHWTSTVHKSNEKEAFFAVDKIGICGDRQNEHLVRAMAYIKEIPNRHLFKDMPEAFLPKQYTKKNFPFMQIKRDFEEANALWGHWNDQKSYNLLLRISVYPVYTAKYQMALSEMYRDGMFVEKDLAISTFWLLQAARSGNKDAQLQIAKKFQKGDNLPKDDEQAKVWFKIAKEE